jgi:CPA1 family monovalent cation:H+ antiporter
MTLFQISALLLTLAAAAAFINVRWIKLPQTIGLMVISLVSSLIVLVLGETGIIPVRALVPFDPRPINDLKTAKSTN